MSISGKFNSAEIDQQRRKGEGRSHIVTVRPELLQSPSELHVRS